MLDSYIIEELRRRERERRHDDERPRLELPVDDDRDDDAVREERVPTGEEPSRGVVVIDL